MSNIYSSTSPSAASQSHESEVSTRTLQANTSSTTASPTKAAATKASLRVRLVLVGIAICIGIVAFVAGVNLYALSTYNEATAMLNSTLEESKAQNPDYDKLKVRQQQADAQLNDAKAWNALLLPHIKQAVSTNSDISQQALSQTEQSIVKQTEGPKSSTTPKAPATQNPQSTTSSGGGLTENQRKQVEELLQANQQPTDTQTSRNESSSTSGNVGGSTDQGIKPW